MAAAGLVDRGPSSLINAMSAVLSFEKVIQSKHLREMKTIGLCYLELSQTAHDQTSMLKE